MTHHIVDIRPILPGHLVVEDRQHQGTLRSAAVERAGSQHLHLMYPLQLQRLSHHHLSRRHRTCLRFVSDQRPSQRFPRAPLTV